MQTFEEYDMIGELSSPTAVKKEIDARVEQIKSELATIEALGGDVVAIKQKYFENLSLANAITEHKRIEDEKQRIAAQQAALAQQVAAVEQAAPAPVAEPQEEEEKTFSLSFKVTGTAAQLNALKAFMVENKIKFERA